MADSHADFLAHFLAHQPALCAWLLSRGVAPDAVDDVVQDIAVVLWRKFDQFEAGTNFRAWAFSVARFEVAKHRDRGRRAPLALSPEASARLEAAVETDATDYARLHRCLAGLGDRARELITWHHVDGRPMAAIAAQLGIAVGAARTRLCRVRKALATCLQREASS